MDVFVRGPWRLHLYQTRERRPIHPTMPQYQWPPLNPEPPYQWPPGSTNASLNLRAGESAPIALEQGSSKKR